MSDVTSIYAQLLDGTIARVDRVVEPGLGVELSARVVRRELTVLQDGRLVYMDLALIKVGAAFGLTQLRLAAGLVDHGGLCLPEDDLLHTVVVIVAAQA